MRQVSGEGRKQWFAFSEFDLFVWYDEASISSFHLIYAKSQIERALIWSRLGKILHVTVDDGARPGKYPSSPLLTHPAPMEKSQLLSRLSAQMQNVDPALEALVMNVIENFDQSPTKSFAI